MRKITVNNKLLAAMILLVVGLLASTSWAQGKGKGNGGGGGGGEEPSDPLPSVRYRVSVTELPIPESGFKEYSGLNEVGQLVGYFGEREGQRGIYIFNVHTGAFTRLDTVIDQTQLPAGWRLGGALDINDHGVIVGYVIDDQERYHACAIDSAADVPVVDLLPRAFGIRSNAISINNAGDILGTEYGDSDTYEHLWTYNPGHYGPTNSRSERIAGKSLDLSDAIPDMVPVSTLNGVESCDLSERNGSSPAFVAGIAADFIPFRYVIGDASVEPLAAVPQDRQPRFFAGVSSFGSVAGQATVVVGSKGKKPTYGQVNYRFNPDLDATFLDLETEGIPEDINNLDEVLLQGNFNRSIYRDWGDGLGERAVSLYDLVIGDTADLALFEASPLFHMNDSGVIVGFAYGTGVETIIVLTPEEATP